MKEASGGFTRSTDLCLWVSTRQSVHKFPQKDPDYPSHPFRSDTFEFISVSRDFWYFFIFCSPSSCVRIIWRAFIRRSSVRRDFYNYLGDSSVGRPWLVNGIRTLQNCEWRHYFALPSSVTPLLAFHQRRLFFPHFPSPFLLVKWTRVFRSSWLNVPYRSLHFSFISNLVCTYLVCANIKIQKEKVYARKRHGHWDNDSHGGTKVSCKLPPVNRSVTSKS